MCQLSAQSEQILTGIASRHGFGFEAVSSMLNALIKGNGAMAQFNHPEFGGPGQWMQGGMTMVSDMFNSHLKGRVDKLCFELSSLLLQQPGLTGGGSFLSQPPPESPDSSAAGLLFDPLAEGSSGHWWPEGLGSPNSTGSQNNGRYAYFAESSRLAVEHLGKLTVYDTQDHQIGGVSQQQSFGTSLQFTSQYGLVDLANLPVVPWPEETDRALAEPPLPQAGLSASPLSFVARDQSADIFFMIEKLAALRDKGILTEAEYNAKKTELLSRI